MLLDIKEKKLLDMIQAEKPKPQLEKPQPEKLLAPLIKEMPQEIPVQDETHLV